MTVISLLQMIITKNISRVFNMSPPFPFVLNYTKHGVLMDYHDLYGK